MPNIASRTFRRALEMSDRRLLDLHIEFQPTSEDDIDSYYELPVPLRSEFQQAFARSRYLDTTIDIFSQVDFGGVVSFPVLERAVLENCRPFAPSAERYSHEQVNAILSAPRLHFITVGAVRWLAAVVPWPFSHVTTFTCKETITKSDLRRLHVACPRLEVLSIRVHWSSDAVGGHGLLTFGALRMLVVHYDGWNPMPVLRHLAAPSLSKLVHDTDSSVCGPDMMHSMIDFIDRSGCQLQELALRVQADCVVGAGDDWYSLFGRLSGLSILKVLVLATDISRSKTAAQKLFSLMKYQGSDQHLPIHVPLPALKCLFFSIEQSEFTCLEGTILQSILESFIDAMKSRKTNTGVTFSSMESASISVRFRSWDGSSPCVDHTVLRGTDGIDLALLHRRLTGLTCMGLSCRMQVGGNAIFSSSVHG
ncbi:hypothetical protein PM082_006755 [Marasmius tenuissimus]|nr:hypothetical protein PM082_006755 [Marasmius tenuissimus]